MINCICLWTMDMHNISSMMSNTAFAHQTLTVWLHLVHSWCCRADMYICSLMPGQMLRRRRSSQRRPHHVLGAGISDMLLADVSSAVGPHDRFHGSWWKLAGDIWGIRFRWLPNVTVALLELWHWLSCWADGRNFYRTIYLGSYILDKNRSNLSGVTRLRSRTFG